MDMKMNRKKAKTKAISCISVAKISGKLMLKLGFHIGIQVGKDNYREGVGNNVNPVTKLKYGKLKN